jgi:hypothetical protein
MSVRLDKTVAELVDVTRQLAKLHTRQDVLVARARAVGATWTQIAGALGVTPQAADKRYRDLKLDRHGRLWRDRRLPL